jgi:hypothetical protein
MERAKLCLDELWNWTKSTVRSDLGAGHHGEWFAVACRHADVLGFDHPQTAQRLMRIAKLNAGAQFDEAAAIQISRKIER